MSKSRRIFAALSLAFALGGQSFAEPFGLGRPALKAEIAAWDIDVRPDGKGLPTGQGSVSTGEEIWTEKCAACHGDFGEGIDQWPAIADGFDSLTDERPLKTVGSYWPYLSTVWDYIHRAMPTTDARSLSPDEVYALTAYILNMNGLVDDDFVLTKSNFTEQHLPNENGFIHDDRKLSDIMAKSRPCMRNCKLQVSITKSANALGVTPE